ncbi:MAG: hypothetical protein U9O94_09115, partial [Nanoarchaeota archaeon]|nr:hypothetical protein [Nanoarchaeota archaeon]
FEQTDDDGEKQVDNGYLMHGLPMRNPYEILAKDYSAKEANQELSKAFMLELEKEEGGYDEESEVYHVSFEAAEKWRRDHYREQFYLAKALFKSFAYHAYLYDMTVHNSEPKLTGFLGNAVSDRAAPLFTGTTVKSGWLSIGIEFTITVKTVNGTVRGAEGVTDGKSQGDFHFSGTTYLPRIEDSKDENDRESVPTWDSDGTDKLVIKVQKNETQYQEMVITDFKSVQTIRDKNFDVSMGYPISEVRLTMPHFVLQDIKYTEFVTVKEHSTVFYAYMLKVVEFDWTGFFIKILFSVAACIVPGGCTVAMALFSVAKTVAVMAATYYLMKIIDDPMLIQAIGLAFNIYQFISNVDVSNMNYDNFLPMANQISGLYTQGQALIDAYEAKDEKERQANEDAKESIDKGITSISGTLALDPRVTMSVLQSFSDSNSPDAFYADALGESLYNYDQYYAVDSAIEMRKKVESG